VLVREGRIVGEGWHAYAGAPHAEAMALAKAGANAQGADAYVTLEPCDHFGRTPPCSRALIAAGVARVFVAVADPNPRAAGGAVRIRESGIPVEMGVLAEKAAAANHQFLFAMRHCRPFVVAKAGCGLDGRIALPSGESKWITSPAARRAAHRLRAECGAVLVGYRTVVADDPHLTARISGVVNQPLRVVLDPRGGLTGRERVFDDAAPTLWLREALSPGEILERVTQAGATGLLIEGGGRTIARFLQAEMVDRLELFMAPRVLGDGPAWCNGLDLASLSDAPGFEWVATRRVGPDLRLTLDRQPPN
jgi:diaminohydroxyphosphoribosylaminopyrimidine deaminase/5-amino-6-(5-phosphoribosylamino)uracil reductase